MPGRGRVANDLEEAEAASRAHVVPAAKGEHLASVDAVLHLRVSRRGQGYRRIRVGLPVLQREGAGVGHRQCVENTGGAGYRGEGAGAGYRKGGVGGTTHRLGAPRVCFRRSRGEPVRPELLRLAPEARVFVAGGHAHHDNVSLWDRELPNVALDHHLADEQDEGWVQAERLRDGAAHPVHLEEGLVVELVSRAKGGSLFLLQFGELLRVG
eukprot:scaffold8680_cov107-Isochrysis_galbana.AAC.2